MIQERTAATADATVVVGDDDMKMNQSVSPAINQSINQRFEDSKRNGAELCLRKGRSEQGMTYPQRVRPSGLDYRRHCK